MAIIKVNPTGTHIQHGFLKVRFDIYPAPTDKTYPIRFLPSIKVLNPMFCHFVRANPAMKLAELESEIERILTPNVLASADAFLADGSRAGFHQFAKLMRGRCGNGLILPRGYDAEKLIAATNKKFARLMGSLDGKGSILDIKPGTITIGAAAIDRGAAYGAGSTRVLKDGPASGTGVITSVEIWFNTNATACEVATFYTTNGNTLSTRDSEALGAIVCGSKDISSGLDMDATAGDYIGLYEPDGDIEVEGSGGAGVWWRNGDSIPCLNSVFEVNANYIISLYGTGAVPSAAGGAGAAAELLLAGQI